MEEILNEASRELLQKLIREKDIKGRISLYDSVAVDVNQLLFVIKFPLKGQVSPLLILWCYYEHRNFSIMRTLTGKSTLADRF